MAGPVFVFGMGLTPAGWSALMTSDASAMCNRCIDAVALFGDEVTEAAIALRADSGPPAMVAAIEPLLTRLLARGGRQATLAFVRDVDAWLAGAASPALDDLLAATACRAGRWSAAGRRSTARHPSCSRANTARSAPRC